MKIKLVLTRFNMSESDKALDADIINSMIVRVDKDKEYIWTLMVPYGLDTSIPLDITINHKGDDGNHKLSFAWDISETSPNDRIFLKYSYSGNDLRYITSVEAEGTCLS